MSVLAVAKEPVLDDTSNDESDDFSDEENTDTTNKLIDKDETNEDEFDLDFKSIATKAKRLKLKPSKTQMEKEKTTPPKAKPAVIKSQKDKNEEECISIQTDVLSEYLKPTKILSKYQSYTKYTNTHL